MRSWSAIFLWALLLLQPGWATLGQAENRTGGPAGVHHCPHAHAPCDAQAVTATADVDHSDCGTCHSLCNLALFGTGALGVARPPSFFWPGATPPPASQPADLPERPQWDAPATV